ncbi:MAG TPA: PEP-CTERM sorting domain-containing protein [Tepidisphaeraceae bacterium]|jgi:hypothetical protein
MVQFLRSGRGVVCAAMVVAASTVLLATDIAHAALTVSATSNAVVDNTAILSGSPPSPTGYIDSVYRGSLGEARAQYEFPLPSLPNGATINSVTFNTYIGGYQSNNNVYPNVNIYSYAGNGVFTTSDAAQLGNLSAQTGPISSGNAISYTLNNVNSLLTSGASHLGLNLYAAQTELRAGFVKQGNYNGIPSLTVNASIPYTGTISAKPTVDAEAESPTSSNFVVTDGDYSVNTMYYPAGQIDRRGIIEFDLGAIPAGSVLSNATIQFYVNALTTGSGQFPQPLIYGYAGNGVLDPSDATATSTLLAIAPQVTTTGLVTFNLNAAQIQSLRNQSQFLGIMVRGSANSNQFGFDTREAAAAFNSTAPTLTFNYSVPEPGALALVGAGGLLALRRRK